MYFFLLSFQQLFNLYQLPTVSRSWRLFQPKSGQQISLFFTRSLSLFLFFSLQFKLIHNSSLTFPLSISLFLSLSLSLFLLVVLLSIIIQVSHGAPYDVRRHAGDLGNIKEPTPFISNYLTYFQPNLAKEKQCFLHTTT